MLNDVSLQIDLDGKNAEFLSDFTNALDQHAAMSSQNAPAVTLVHPSRPGVYAMHSNAQDLTYDAPKIIETSAPVTVQLPGGEAFTVTTPIAIDPPLNTTVRSYLAGEERDASEGVNVHIGRAPPLQRASETTVYMIKTHKRLSLTRQMDNWKKSHLPQEFLAVIKSSGLFSLRDNDELPSTRIGVQEAPIHIMGDYGFNASFDATTGHLKITDSRA
jgi:hypothetical protein